MGKRNRSRPSSADQLPLDLRVKRCPCCHQELAGWDFVQSRGRKNGLSAYCLRCTRVKMAAMYDKPGFREKAAARNKAWNEKNPGRMSQRGKAWYRANRERRRKASLAWSDANRDKHRALNAAWARANPEAAKAIGSRYYARKITANTAHFTGREVAERWAYYGNKCWICGATATATDHVKPLAKGGAHMLCNLRPVCAPCNGAKRDKWPFKPEMIQRVCA